MARGVRAGYVALFALGAALAAGVFTTAGAATGADPAAPGLPAEPSSSAPAPLLTAAEAVRLGLENNFALALVRDQTDLATLNRQTGAGAFLPTASASASHGGELGTDAPSRTTVGVGANLQIFNGFQTTFAYRRLKTQETAAVLREQAAVESTVESILAAYYEVARQKLGLSALREALAVSRERAELARSRQEVGAGSRLEFLQAQADLNADSSALMSQENALREARFRLNGLLGRAPAIPFDVPDTIPVEHALAVDAWRAALAERNPTLREARAQVRASELSVREARGAYLPTLSGGLSYSTAPEALNPTPSVTTSDAINYSLNLSLPLFTGLRTRQSVGTSRINLRRQETTLKQVEQEILTEYAQAEARYASGLRQIELEERNIEVARLQAEAARERYRVGASSALEFRDAQQRLLTARVRLATVRQTAKQSELSLKRLAGVLATPVSPEH
ncbi:MAG TPA: TolC family protein [Fibrobacteria bacterium]|nr:TolC family protein [Fibrobacteria bacterium]